MGLRRKSRELAVQALYMYDVADISIDDLISFKWMDKQLKSKILLYASDLINGTLENLNEIDEVVKKIVDDNFTLKRMGLIEKAIIRVMGFEIINTDIPELVIINEGIEIAKKYGDDNSHKFVNGILDEIRKEFRKNSE